MKKLIFVLRISGLFDFGSPVYVIRDPHLIKQLAVKEFDHFVDHKFMLDGDHSSLFGRALFNLRGQKWRGWLHLNLLISMLNFQFNSYLIRHESDIIASLYRYVVE